MLLLTPCQDFVLKHVACLVLCMGVLRPYCFLSVFFWEVFVCLLSRKFLIGSCSPIGATPCLIS